MIVEPAVPADLVHFVRAWLGLLARGDDERAMGQLDEPNCWGIRWSSLAIHKAIDDAFSPGCRFRRSHPDGLRVTEPDLIGGSRWDSDSVNELREGTGYAVTYIVPLNGEWSDLSIHSSFDAGQTVWR